MSTSSKQNSIFRVAIAGGLACFYGATLSAQETPRFTFDLGGGFTQPVGGTSRRLDTGWNVRGGAGVNFNRHVGLLVDLNYNQLGVNSRTLGNIGFPGGNLGVFSATLDPVFHVSAYKRADLYVVGGGGLYRTMQEFTQPSSASFLGFDPFFGFYNLTVPTTEVLSSYSVNKPGVNLGGGIAVGTKWRGKVFAEARYHRIFRGNDRRMDYIPVSFGYRW